MKVREIEKLLNEALEAAKMENCHFGFNTVSNEYTERIVEDTKLYRETWIIHPLRRALKLLEAGSSCKRFNRGGIS